MKKTPSAPLNAVSLFAGGGGLTLGLEHAGFRTVLATDIEASSAATFHRNRPDVRFYLGDIRRLSRDQLLRAVGPNKIDLVAGGPPCQGFSTLGDQNPADPRNGLFWCFVRAVEWLDAPAFLMENVNYLRTQYGGRFEREIVSAFERLGFRVSVMTLNAADFGCPQIRKRVFFFGTKKNGSFSWPEPTHGDGRSLPHTDVWSAISDLSENTADVPNHLHLRHSDKVIARYKLIPQGGRLPPPSELPEEIRRKNFGNTYKRLHKERPSLTLVPGNNAFPIHPTLDRSLSAREAARLQTFPDEYVFEGTRAEQCRLVGNAVPVRLASAIGAAVRHHLQDTTTALPSVIPFVPLTALPRSARKRLTAVSFFTGIGGLMLGFQNAGVEIAASYDLKNSVEKNAEINFPKVKHVRADVSSMTTEDVVADVGDQTIDIVFGGPPCQGFSMFGKRRFVNTKDHQPDQDPRNELSIKFVELAVSLKPKAIFMENVKGFVSTKRGNGTYLTEILSHLSKAGYDFKYEVVNCAWYGVPQARERFILVAWQRGTTYLWPTQKHFEEPKAWQRAYVTVGDVISDLMDPATHSQEFSHVPMAHKDLVVERYKLIPEGGRLPEDTLPAHLKKGYRTDNVRNYSHVHKRLSMSRPATTMVPGHNAFPVHPTLHRTLTVREAARIQTFPDSVRVTGTRQQQCTLIGNAVPPLLAEIFAASMVKSLMGNFEDPGYKRDVYDLAAAE